MYRPGLPLSEFDNAMTVAKLNGEWVGPKRSTNGEGRKNYVDRGPEPVDLADSYTTTCPSAGKVWLSRQKEVDPPCMGTK